MNTSDAREKALSTGEGNIFLCFGEWLRRRRMELDLTQVQLARRASCSVFAIRKIESGERRPSRELTRMLAQALDIPCEDQAAFVRAARGELSLERMPSLARPPAQDSRPTGPPAPLPAHLPRALTPFIGREPEIAALGELLNDPQCSLITIAGPGGIGKTRLAIEAANQHRHIFPDGVWFVPLISLNSPTLLVPAIADAVNFRSRDPANPKIQLLQYLCEKKALFIVDNAEHLLDGVGLFAELLHACPQVKLLVTSRERLNLLSEWVFEIQGLPVPASDRVEQFESYSSVALFLQSARRVRAGFEAREVDRRCVLRICQMMEGMPLGLELAAAWIGVLSCEEIAREIERNIDFLSVTMRDLPERHRSLRATLDHSWKLLSAEEKLILSRISIFHGKFRREAAEEICGASLAVLSSFRNKMLLYRTDQDFYSLHEFIRQYAEHKLRENPAEDERIRDRHSSYFVRRLSEWEKALKSSRQFETYQEMGQVVGDLLRGWQRMVNGFHPQALENGQFCPDLFHRSLFSLSLYCETHNRSPEAIALFQESVAYLKSMHSAFENPDDRTTYYAVLGHTTAYLGLHHFYIPLYEQAQALLEEAIRLLALGQERVIQAQVRVMLGSTLASIGQLQKAADLLEQSREVFRPAGEVWWLALANINLTPPLVSLGKLAESEVLLQEAFGLVEPGDFRLGKPLRQHYGYVLSVKKDFAKAEQIMLENLQLGHQYGTLDQTASILFELGRLALATQKYALAEERIQESIHDIKESGQVADLPMPLIYLGKCFAAQNNLPAACEQFQQVIHLGQKVDKPHMVYWGLVHMARMFFLAEDQIEKSLEMALALRRYPIEFIRMKEEFDSLLADLQARLPPEQVAAAQEQVDRRLSPDPAGLKVLAFAIERMKV